MWQIRFDLICAGVVTYGLRLWDQWDVRPNSLKQRLGQLVVEKWTFNYLATALGHSWSQHANCMLLTLETSLALCCVTKLHILDWPFIVRSTMCTCVMIMLLISWMEYFRDLLYHLMKHFKCCVYSFVQYRVNAQTATTYELRLSNLIILLNLLQSLMVDNGSCKTACLVIFWGAVKLSDWLID
jgi:hypothetical protein